MERRELTHVTTVVRNVPVRAQVNAIEKDNNTAQDYLYLKKTSQSNVNSLGKNRRVFRVTAKEVDSKPIKQNFSTSTKNLESSSDKSDRYQKVSDWICITIIFIEGFCIECKSLVRWHYIECK